MSKDFKTKLSKALWTSLGALLVLGIATVVLAQANTNKYMGANKCKSCHSSEKIGNQYGKWASSKHSQAFTNLAGAKAKELGTKAGVADPQTGDKCVKCHVTAFGVAKDLLDAKFDSKLGVQCEGCHGPGGKHMKARMAAAAAEGDAFGGGAQPPAPIPADEIKGRPDAKVCAGCHNKESPSYVGFDFDKTKKEIAHPIPKK
jgi:hypothetical protein